MPKGRKANTSAVCVVERFYRRQNKTRTPHTIWGTVLKRTEVSEMEQRCFFFVEQRT